MVEPQYIRTIKNLEFEDIRGRSTRILEGVPGFVLTESIIDNLFEITEKQRRHCFEKLEQAKDHGKTLALVQGYPCALGDDDFVKCAKPKSYLVPGEII